MRIVSIVMGDSGTAVVREVQLSLAGTRGPDQIRFSGPWKDAVAQTASLSKRWAPLVRVDLIVPVERCLVLEHRMPNHALPRAADILALELERTTPLRRSQVLHDFFKVAEDSRPGTAMIRHVTILKSTIEPLLSDLSGQSVRVGTIRVQNFDGTLLPIDLLAQAEDRPATLSGRLSLMVAAGAAASVLLAFINALSGIWALEAALKETTLTKMNLEQKVAQVRKSLAAQDTLESRAKALRLRSSERVSTLQVWEEVTQLLPGSAWITELRLDDGILYLDGLSRSASELVGIFSRSNIFNKVEFVSPVTRDAQQGLERFQIRMKVERRAGQRLTAQTKAREGGQ